MSDKSTANIRWHSTDVALDLHCDCGYTNYIVGLFAFQIKCRSCGTIYKLDTAIKISKIDSSEEDEPLVEIIRKK